VLSGVAGVVVDDWDLDALESVGHVGADHGGVAPAADSDLSAGSHPLGSLELGKSIWNNVVVDREVAGEGDDGDVVDEGVRVVGWMSHPGTSLLLLGALVLSDVMSAGDGIEGSVDGAVASRNGAVTSVEGSAAEVGAESLKRKDVRLRVWVGSVTTDDLDFSVGGGGEGESCCEDLKCGLKKLVSGKILTFILTTNEIIFGRKLITENTDFKFPRKFTQVCADQLLALPCGCLFHSCNSSISKCFLLNQNNFWHINTASFMNDLTTKNKISDSIRIDKKMKLFALLSFNFAVSANIAPRRYVDLKGMLSTNDNLELNMLWGYGCHCFTFSKFDDQKAVTIILLQMTAHYRQWVQDNHEIRSTGTVRNTKNVSAVLVTDSETNACLKL